jgi:hypothetical protein
MDSVLRSEFWIARKQNASEIEPVSILHMNRWDTYHVSSLERAKEIQWLRLFLRNQAE